MMRPRAMSASSNGSFQDRKNVPCRHWVSKGHCDLGSDCKFSHNNPANYPPRKLCKNYSATGKCPHGASCHFLHAPHTGAVGGAGRVDNQKTVMCKNWLESGSCNYGDKCSYAHGEDEIRSSKEKRIIAQNPMYKTTICKMFAEGDYCELAENCHFAHGEDELRVFKPPDKTDLSNDPLYKTQICNNWQTEEGCEYGDGCRFAHGTDELRILKPSDLIAAGVWNTPTSKVMSPQYKTVMCNQPDCKFGSSNCNFAHSQGELRTVQQNLAEINPNYKGTLCKYFMADGVCEFGNICQYAHGESELRQISPGLSNGNRNLNQSFGGSSFNSLQYKTQLCKNYQESGNCDFGSQCQFAHGMMELRTASQNHAPFPPSARVSPSPHVSSVPRDLCMSWLQTGMCLARGDCGSAHSLMELSSPSAPSINGLPSPRQQMTISTNRKPLCRNIREKGYCPYGTVCQFSHNQSQHDNSPSSGSGAKPIKVVMCQDYTSGNCSRGDSCSFAHGQQELQEYRSRQVPNYKTTMCQSYNRTGTCQWGDTCMYAHGSRELRNKFLPGYGGSDCKRVKL